MIPVNSQQDESWAGIQEFLKKPKKELEFFPKILTLEEIMDYTFPQGIPVGKEEGETLWIPKLEWKKWGKGSFGREKSGKMPEFDWNFRGKKKKELKEQIKE